MLLQGVLLILFIKFYTPCDFHNIPTIFIKSSSLKVNAVRSHVKYAKILD